MYKLAITDMALLVFQLHMSALILPWRLQVLVALTN